MKQASLEKGKSEVSSNEDVDRALESAESIVSQINEMTISGNPSVATPPLDSTECSATGDHVPDIDKRIRALKKKVKSCFIEIALLGYKILIECSMYPIPIYPL